MSSRTGIRDEPSSAGESGRLNPSAGTSRSAIVLVNSNAGAVLETDRTAFCERIVTCFADHGYNATVQFVAGNDLVGAFQNAIVDDGPLIVVAGGDGSVNAVLPWAMASRALFAILPLGTLNLIAQDIGLTGNLEQDIAAIAQGADMACDIVMANGRFFHSNAGLGLFVTMALERQAARHRFPFSKKFGFGWAALKTLFRRNRVEISYTMEDKTTVMIADAVLVTNNRFFGTPWRRSSLQDGVLELHVLKAPSLRQRFAVIAAVARGTWRDLDNLTTVSASTVTIRRRRRNSMRITLDGEIATIGNPLTFTVIPGALCLRSGYSRNEVAGA